MAPTEQTVQLAVRRHAESTWNAQRRIQGGTTESRLSDCGAAEAAAWAQSLPSTPVIGTIWSSDAQRCRATACYAADRLRLPVTVNKVLREAAAGVLEGLPHADAAIRYPAEHQAWLSRGDLDLIPGAESGDRVQARALAFLALATGPGGAATFGTGQIVVTHAAFMRSLINTYHRRQRATPVAVAHRDRHHLRDPWSRLDPVDMGSRWRPGTYRVCVGPDGSYLVKLRRGLANEKARRHYVRIQRAAARATGSPSLLALAAAGTGRAAFTVRRFVPGNPVPHRVSTDEEWQLYDFYQSTSEAIRQAVPADSAQQVTSLGYRVRAVLEGPATEASGQLRRLVADTRVAALLGRRVLVTDFDLHRDNTLRDSSGKLVKIDFDALCAGPALWGHACALVGASALYPGSVGRQRDRPHARILSGHADRSRELRLLVAVRLLLGWSFFLTGPRAEPGCGAEHYAFMYRSALTELPDRRGIAALS